MRKRMYVLLGVTVVVNLAIVGLDAWLWFQTHQWYQPLLGAVNFGCAAFLAWRLLWDYKNSRTSSSTFPNLSPSSWSQFAFRVSNPPSDPRPNVSPSLPEFTADQPLVGYRSWNEHDDGLLWSINNHAAWSVDRMEAKCTPELGRSGNYYIPATFYMSGEDPKPCKTVPEENHSCGLYLLSKPAEDGLLSATNKANGALYGAVIAWGKVVRHGSEGFRAQYGKVLCLTLPDAAAPGYADALEKARIRTERAARNYGVPVIPASQLARYISEFGTTADTLAVPAIAEKASA